MDLLGSKLFVLSSEVSLTRGERFHSITFCHLNALYRCCLLLDLSDLLCRCEQRPYLLYMGKNEEKKHKSLLMAILGTARASNLVCSLP